MDEYIKKLNDACTEKQKQINKFTTDDKKKKIQQQINKITTDIQRYETQKNSLAREIKRQQFFSR